MTKAIILIFDGQSFLALHRLTQNRVSVPFPSVHVHRIALQSTAGPQRGAAAFWKTADPHVFYGNFWIFFILNKLHILYPNPNPAPTQHRKLPAFSHFQKKTVSFSMICRLFSLWAPKNIPQCKEYLNHTLSHAHVCSMSRNP